MLNAIASSVLGWVHTWNTSSFAFIMLFTSLKTSSRGIRSGEYGGRNTTLAFALVSIKFTTWSRWWIAQLSMITTEWLLFPSNGFKIGIRVFMTKSSNLCPFTVPSTSWTSCMPSRDITATPEYLTPLARSLRSRGDIPLTEYPNFLMLLYQSHPVSSPKQALQGRILRFRTWIWLDTHQTATKLYAVFSGDYTNFRVLQIVETLTSTPNIWNSCCWISCR